jgi:hypothetical protein
LKTILYTKDFNKQIKEQVDVILSPQYYWIKKINIPVKNRFTAKKIAKNIFDFDEKEYFFDAVKIKDTYFAIAINKNLKLKIPKKYIKSLRIAQVEFYDYDCLNVSENHSIRKIEDIHFCFPKKNDCKNVDEILNSLKLSGYKINLFNTFEDKGLILLVAFIFIILNVYLLSFNIAYSKDIKKLNFQKNEFLKKHNLPKTTFQLQSVYENLKNKQLLNDKIKTSLEFISKTPCKEFLKLSFKNDIFYVKIKSDKNLDNFFKKRFRILNSNYKNNIYEARLK